MKNKDPKGTKTASLRWRLTLVSLAMLVLALVALDAAIYIGLHQRYYSDLRANLAEVVSQANTYTPGDTESLQVTANRLSRSNVVAVIYQNGRYQVVGKLSEPESLKLRRELRVQGPTITWDASTAKLNIAIYADSGLILQTRNPFAPARGDSVLFIASKAPVEASLRRLLVAELVGTLLVLALAVLIVGVAIKLTLRPLDRMATVADRITAGDIRQRLRPSKASTELGKLATALDAMLDSLASSLTSERHAH